MNSRFDGPDFWVDEFVGKGLGIEVCVDDLGLGCGQYYKR